MKVKGTKTVVAEWASNGELLIGQGKNSITLSPNQATELLRFIDERIYPSIENYQGEKEAHRAWEKSKPHNQIKA